MQELMECGRAVTKCGSPRSDGVLGADKSPRFARIFPSPNSLKRILPSLTEAGSPSESCDTFDQLGPAPSGARPPATGDEGYDGRPSRFPLTRAGSADLP